MDERESGAPVTQPETKEPTTEVSVGHTDSSAHETLERLAQRTIPDYIPTEPVSQRRIPDYVPGKMARDAAKPTPALSERTTRTSNAIGAERIGPYLTLEQLAALQQDLDVSKNVRFYAEAASGDIQRHGNDALAHLVLPSRVYNALRFRGLTIPTLREALKAGDIRYISNARGPAAMATIVSALAAYDRELAAHAAEQPPKPGDEHIP